VFSYVRSRLAEQVIRTLNTVEKYQHVCGWKLQGAARERFMLQPN
jgi:hypothetical protein